jgi:hypothetical protein
MSKTLRLSGVLEITDNDTGNIVYSKTLDMSREIVASNNGSQRLTPAASLDLPMPNVLDPNVGPPPHTRGSILFVQNNNEPTGADLFVRITVAGTLLLLPQLAPGDMMLLITASASRDTTTTGFTTANLSFTGDIFGNAGDIEYLVGI